MSELLVDHEYRAAVLNNAAIESGIDVTILEKDLWVCWLLGRLAEVPGLPTVTFKGGTSLSKVHKLIHRFSEDIDLTLARPAQLADPMERGISSNERKRRLRAVTDWAVEVVGDAILSGLRNRCASLRGAGGWELELSEVDTQSILFRYPAPVGSSAYLKPVVMLEFGARGDPHPTEVQEVVATLEELLPGTAPTARATVQTLTPVRTFWEKVCLLHSLHQTGLTKEKPVGRMSRHVYDVHQIWHREEQQALIRQSQELLVSVVGHRQVFFKDPKANYPDILDGRLTARPQAALSSAFRRDYEAMQEMFFSDRPPPEFEQLLGTLAEIDAMVAAWGRLD